MTGMMAKLKIAVTMARNAKLYLLDEPLNGIDLLARDEIMKSILEVIDPDVTLVISSHLVDELERVADAAIFMKEGKMVRQCIDCWEAEKNLRTTPGSDCALTSLAIDEPLEYARLYLDGNLQMCM